MKTRYTLLFLLCLLVASCGEDRRLEYADRTNLTHWIYDTMEDYYLWYDGLDEKKSKLNYHQRPETFFTGLLDSRDKNYSHLEIPEEEEETKVTTRSVAKDAYGFEFQYSSVSKTSKQVYARVLYVDEDSPAAEAGLERGEWIFSISGHGITASGVDSLRSGKTEVVLETGNVQSTEDGLVQVDVRTKTLGPSRDFEKNPILFYDTFVRNNNRIGYLVYNSFVAGKGDGEADVTYLNELAALSNYFKSQNVNEFILDLRYNPGGELNRPVPLICTMLAPASAMDQVMGGTVYNDKHQSMNGEIKFLTEHLYGGSNLDLERVFILVNKSFTASASEAVINFLEPYTKDLQLIGTGTYGKNVGSQKFVYETDPRYVLHPIVCTLENSEGFSDYASGFTVPTGNQVDELSAVEMHPFGETDLLVARALEIIENVTPAPVARSAGSPQLNTIGNSLEGKIRPAAIIR